MENSINNIIVFSIQEIYQDSMNNRIHFLMAYHLYARKWQKRMSRKKKEEKQNRTRRGRSIERKKKLKQNEKTEEPKN